jgi:GNAT superfamily N-acetyltransferase
MENGIKIRRAKAKDLKDVLRLNAELYKEERKRYNSNWNVRWVYKEGRKAISRDLYDKDGYIIVAQSRGKIIAFLRASAYRTDWMAWKSGKGAEVWDIFIEKKFRNKNIGTALLSAFLQWCKQKKVDYILTNVTTLNKDAIEFYTKFGFKNRQTIMEKKIS